MIVKYLNHTYEVNDSFGSSIASGSSQPYVGEMDIVKDYLQEYPDKKKTFLDIGGHIGTFSIPFAEIFKCVHSYEPNGETFELLKRNIKLNNITNIIAYNFAVSSHGNSMKIVRYGNNTGCYYSLKDSSGDIKSVILDKLEYQNVDFIKVDIGGGELDVLKGCHNILVRDKPLLEVNIGLSYKNHQVTEDDIFDYIYSLGYTIFDINNDYFFYCP